MFFLFVLLLHVFFFSFSFCALFFVRVSQSKRSNEKTMGEGAGERKVILYLFLLAPSPMV